MRAGRRVGVRQLVVRFCLLTSRLRIESYRNVRLNKEHAERDRKLRQLIHQRRANASREACRREAICWQVLLTCKPTEDRKLPVRKS